MAYINDDEQDSDQGSMNVFGPQGQDLNQQMQQTQQPPSVTGGQSADITGQAQQQQVATQPQAKTSKGSGMFTDIRKYVQANQPQAAQLGQAIQQNVGEKASQIRQQVEQQQKSFQQRVGEQQARLQQAQAFGQQALQQAQAGQTLDPEQVQRFQALTGGQERFEGVGNLGLTGQGIASQQLQDLTKQAERASGASRLLRETFGDQGKQYTRGQQSLDALLLGRDQSTRQQLVEGTQQASKNIEQQIRDARQAALRQASGLSEAGEQFRAGLGEQLAGAREAARAEVTSEVEKRRQELQAKQAAFEKALGEGTLTREQLLEFLPQEQMEKAAQAFEKRKQLVGQALGLTTGSSQAQREALEQLGIEGGSGFANLAHSQGGFLRDLARSLQTGQVDVSTLLDPEQEWVDKQDMLRSARFGLQQLQSVGIDPYEVAKLVSSSDQQALEDLKRREDEVAQMRRLGGNVGGNLTQQYFDEISRSQMPAVQQMLARVSRTPESYIQDLLRETARQKDRGLTSLLTRTRPEEFTEANVITDAQLARQNALAALAGRVGEGIERQGTAPVSPGTFDILAGLRRLGVRGL